MRRRLAALVCATLLLSLLPTAAPQTADGVASGWEVVVKVDSATSGTRKAFEAFDTASLNLYDFNGDGQLEIVSSNDNNHHYVIDSRTGKVLAELETYHFNNASWPVRELNPIAIGELYGDDRPCMVIPNSAAYMSAWCYDAALSTPTAFNFTKMWEIRVDAKLYEPDFREKHPWIYADNDTDNDYPGLDGPAYLSDVDGDGKLEVFVETDGYPGQFAFNHDGTYRWSRSFADGNAGAKVVDIDEDGRKEAVFVSDGGLVTAYDASTGRIEWVFETRKAGATPGSVPVPPLVADLHGDGKYETVFGARVAVQTNDPDWINQSHARYFALDHRGAILWNVSYEWMNPLQYNHPAPYDVNEDGVLDVIFLDWNTIGHKPGNWNTTNRKSNLFALDGRDGSVLWQVGIPIYWSNKDFVIADADGDGEHDIIVPNPSGSVDGLGVYDVRDGRKKGWFPLDWSMSRGPVAGDLYGTGELHLVVPVTKRSTEPNYRKLDVGLRMGELRIVATGQRYDAPFSANLLLSDAQPDEQKGTVGTPPPTPPTPPTPVTVEPTPTSPTPEPTPPPEPTPTPTPPPPEPTPPEPTATPTPTPSTPPSVPPSQSPPPVDDLPPPTPSTQESSDNIPVAVGLLLAALAAAAVLLPRKRAP